jgi:hypothetical protein
VLRRFRILALAALVLAGAGFPPARAAAQKKPADNITAEQVAETVVLVYGARERLAQIRRTGVERGKVTRTAEDGRIEEINYERSFKRGESFDKDKIRLDQRKPTLEYTLILNEGSVFGVVRGTPFTPRAEDVGIFMADRVHGVETLLRYKESGATVSLAGKDTQKGLELWMLDLEDKGKRKTRYFISAKSGKVLWLEYEETPQGGAKPVRYKRTFHDYRVVQGTFYPYRSVLYADDRQVEELNVLTVVFGIKLEDAAFQNPQAAAARP